MTTYEDLVDATLPHGLMPLVVPQLKTITLGGAVTGLGIESTSFRNGLPHESVLEMEVLTGDGRVVIATRDNEHADLFYGFPNSYGTLGYTLRLKIELRAGKPYVALRHVRFADAAELLAAMGEIGAVRRVRGRASTSSTARCSAPTSCTSRWALRGPARRASPTTPASRSTTARSSERVRRLPDDPRLPVALGHRLVLVLARVRRAEPAGPPAVAAPQAALRRLPASWWPRPAATDFVARVDRWRGPPRRGRTSSRTSRCRSSGCRSSWSSSTARSA